MPKIVDYPRASLRRAVALAEAVDKLGGEASDQSIADGMGNKVGGAFRALISSAVKYGLVSQTKGRVKTEPLYTDYKLAYTEQEKQKALRRAFLNAPLFQELADRLKGQVIPGHFEKLIIREHDVPEDVASRIASYFVEGAKETGIITPSGVINATPQQITGGGSLQAGNAEVTDTLEETESVPDSVSTLIPYSVRIYGPGIDSRISIKDEDDVDIVEAMLKKVRRLIKAQQEKEPNG